VKKHPATIQRGLFNMEKFIANNQMLAQKYASDFSIPLELAQIVAQRFPGYDDAKRFLFPDINHLHDSESMPDIKRATTEIIESIKKGEGILIYCHDDVDGYTSAVITYKTLKDLGQEDCPLYIYPIIREKDGYVLNPEILREYKQKGVKLILTVDFGISNAENFRIAEEVGLKLIVCDHHETNVTNFPVPAVDPKRIDSKYPFCELAGVGVAFKLAQSLYQKAFNLTAAEFYSLKKGFFPIVLIGTISDRVMLREENRVFCFQGLRVLSKLDEPWIRFFRQEGEINLAKITGEIIPVIASAAYVDPNLGVGIFLSHDEHYVAEAVARLKLVDAERKQAIESLFKEAISAAKIFPKIVISVIPFSKQHHLGSVSSRLKEYLKRTSVVIGLQNGKCFGELRSYGVNLYKMLYHLSDLFLDFGGHQKAAGFSMRQENLDKFIEEAVRYVADHGDEMLSEYSSSSAKPEVFLNKPDINVLSPLMPFGEGNPAPLLTDGFSIYTIDNKFNIIEQGEYGKS